MFKVRAGFRENDVILEKLRESGVKVNVLDLPNLTVYETNNFYIYGDIDLSDHQHAIYVFKSDIPDFIKSDKHNLSNFLRAIHELIWYSDELDEYKLLEIEYRFYFDEMNIAFVNIQENRYADGGDETQYTADYVITFRVVT